MAGIYNSEALRNKQGPNTNDAFINQANFASNNSGAYYTQHQQRPSQLPNQSQHQQQQQQKQAATNTFSQPSIPVTNLFNPANAATAAALLTGNQDALFQAGEKIIGKVPGRVQPGVGRIMGALRVYFAVDNLYVQKKMQRVLFPFVFKGWKRQELEPITPPPNPDGSYPPAVIQHALPITDVNAPDLYLPVMSLITYVLLCAFLYGSSGKFTPEVLPDVTTKCIITQILEVLVIRFAFYAMQVPTPLGDLFAYTGYKYLGLCVNMLVGLLGFGRNGYYIGFLWTATSVSFFMLKVMANGIPRHTASEGPKRDIMVMVIAGSQFLTMWFVSQTKYLE